MKQNKFIQALVVFVCLIMASCSKEEQAALEQDKSNLLQISITDNSYSSKYPTVYAETDTEYRTVFTSGDRVGLFAVKNGQIVSDVNNIPLTYNGSAWTFEAGTSIEYTTEKEGAKYYAYYPYDADKGTAFAPANADPFIAMEEGWEVGENQKEGNYTKGDLMTGSAEAVLTGPNYRLNITLVHRMALVVIKLPSVTYNFTNTSPILSPYSIMPKNIVFSWQKDGGGDVSVFPYYHASTGSYRLLVNPKFSHLIRGQFTTSSNADRQYTIDLTAGASRGTYVTYTIDGGTQVTSHELKVGDFYCADGSIVAGDAASIPGNCIGIVYYVGNPGPSSMYATDYTATQDVLTRTHSVSTHGLVIGLKQTVNRFATASTTEMRLWYRTEFADAGSYIDLSGNVWDGSATTSAVAPERPRVLGYNNTQLMKLFAQTKSVNFVALQELDNYTDTAPSVSSGWYLPSFGDFNTLNPSVQTINQQMAKVSGTNLIIDGNYWTSTERNASNMYYATLRTAATAAANTGGQKNNASHVYNYRFALAF